MTKTVSFPEAYTGRIEQLLAAYDASLDRPARLAECVLRLSDFYIGNPDGQTPWDKDWAQIAYLCYFFPLNYLRVRGVVGEAVARGFWQGLTSYSDFGSGVGTVPLALADLCPGQFTTARAIERSAAPQRLYNGLRGPSGLPLAWQNAPGRPEASTHAKQHAHIFSFSLTELPSLPGWAKASEALVLIEPATSQDGRRLMELRSTLLADGYHIWAPCTHAQPCPLLTHSGRDWCHDRVHWQAPGWFERLSELLPMKNPSLAYSYLLARRQPPLRHGGNVARLTGDLMREKGASRQLVCRGSDREFLSWQHKLGEPPQFPRGVLVDLAPDMVKKSHELRPLPGQCTLAEAGTGTPS